MKILITGAAGFIGSNFIHWLMQNTDHEVWGIDNFSGGFAENVIPEPFNRNNQRLTMSICDVLDSEKFGATFAQFKPDVCYHFAAYAAEGLSPFIRKFNYTNNTVGTASVVNECIKHDCKLIFTSSVAVYSGEPPFNEETTPNPIDPYGVSKYASELDIRIAGQQHGLRYTIIRPRNVYGERQNLWDKYRNVFGIWMNQIRKGEPMTIYGDGSQRRSFTYVGDIMEPLYRAATMYSSNHATINLGSAQTYSIDEASHILAEVVSNYGYMAIRSFLESRHEVKEAFCETYKSEIFLGFKDKTTLQDGLTAMWNWAVSQPDREIKEMPLELDKGIYKFWKK